MAVERTLEEVTKCLNEHPRASLLPVDWVPLARTAEALYEKIAELEAKIDAGVCSGCGEEKYVYCGYCAEL